MSRLEPTPPPSPPQLAERSYLGYRWPGLAAAVRLASGEHVALGADGGAGLRLAEAVLSDRLGHAPCDHLLDSFLRDWVAPLPRGEFAWPVEAVDDWLVDAAPARLAAPNPCTAGPLVRALQVTRRVLRAPLAHHPVPATTPLPPGAH